MYVLAESGWKAAHPSGAGCYCNQTGTEGANSTRTTYARECVVLRFRGDRICELRDYTNAALYERFLQRHRSELPKFTPR